MQDGGAPHVANIYLCVAVRSLGVPNIELIFETALENKLEY